MQNLKFTTLLFFLSFALFGQMKRAKVISVLDGDTIIVLLVDNTQKKLRLAEIDCPEKGQPFGNNAKRFTSDAVYLQDVFYKEYDNDKYGRTIARVYYGKEMKYLSEELVRNGLAWHYKRYSNSAILHLLEKQARKQGVGLWSSSERVEPWNWRKSKTAVKRTVPVNVQIITPIKINRKARKSFYRKEIIIR